jgi:uncharacterized membrane protein
LPATEVAIEDPTTAGGQHAARSQLQIYERENRKETTMLLFIFFVLLVLWFLGFLAFHVTTGLIHLLLIVAVIALILHFVRGTRSAV